MIRDRVREEVYCREAMALGLDKDDTIIRRRLRQKMEFVTDDVAAQAEPTDDELSAYLNAHADAFRVQRHSRSARCISIPSGTAKIWRVTPRNCSRSCSRPATRPMSRSWAIRSCWNTQFQSLPASEVGKQFGEKFAAKLGELRTGPMAGAGRVRLRRASGAGQRAHGRTLPALAEVRDAVRREWANARRLEANEKFYQELLKRYVVTIERPTPARSKKRMAGHEE